MNRPCWPLHSTTLLLCVRSFTLDLGLRRTFHWTFIIADVNKPILVAAFFQNFDLLIDIRHHRLSDSVTHLKVKCILSDSPSSAILFCSKDLDDPYLSSLKYPSVTQASSSNRLLKHNVTYHNIISGPLGNL